MKSPCIFPIWTLWKSKFLIYFSESTSVLLEGLKPYTRYKVLVRTHGDHVISQYSTPMIVRTKEGGMYTRSNAFVITTAIADDCNSWWVLVWEKIWLCILHESCADWNLKDHNILHTGVTPSSPAKVSSYLPFDKPFASRPSKFIISAALSTNENARKDFFDNPFLPIRLNIAVYRHLMCTSCQVSGNPD